MGEEFRSSRSLPQLKNIPSGHTPEQLSPSKPMHIFLLQNDNAKSGSSSTPGTAQWSPKKREAETAPGELQNSKAAAVPASLYRCHSLVPTMAAALHGWQSLPHPSAPQAAAALRLDSVLLSRCKTHIFVFNKRHKVTVLVCFSPNGGGLIYEGGGGSGQLHPPAALAMGPYPKPTLPLQLPLLQKHPQHFSHPLSSALTCRAAGEPSHAGQSSTFLLPARIMVQG